MVKTGVSVIKEYLKTMPLDPGVYRMLDCQGKVLYVGKAKNLKKRVVSYTHITKLSKRIQTMVSNTVAMEIIITKTELESLLLEANLIKKFSPRYNILLKDGKSHPYISIDITHKYPRIFKYRGVRNKKAVYFGPFPSVDSVDKTISDICKAFLLRSCSDSEFSKRTRACMEYQIKRCSAPCVNKITKEEYSVLVDQAKYFLSGKSKSIQEKLVKKMLEESEVMNYEKALVYRDRIKALNKIQASQNINVFSLENSDIIGLFRQGSEVCIQVFFFRNGKNLGNYPSYISVEINTKEEDIIDAFLLQYYQSNAAPKNIILSHQPNDKNLMEKALSLLSNKKISIFIPKHGKKKDIINNVIKNAEECLYKDLISKEKHKYILSQLVDVFGLNNIPERIEIYDNSHISGKYEVGVMVVSGRNGFIKSEYRKFNIKGKDFTKGDDYSMLKEVLNRRLQRLQKEYPKKEKGVWPDVLLIDGGEGHLSTANRVLETLSLDKEITLVCISKGVDRNSGREQFHMIGKKAFRLPKLDPVLYYLQNLRDEAHNFAVTSHKNIRNKSMVKSSLDSIVGVGSKRKKILLNYFGSIDAIKQASISDLLKIKGINKSTAAEIYNNFH